MSLLKALTRATDTARWPRRAEQTPLVQAPASDAVAPYRGEGRLFDDLTRSIASSPSRRVAMKTTFLVLSGLMLSKVGIRPAWAAANCLCNGVVFDSDLSCCTPTGVVQKNPIADLTRCPGRVANATHTCVPNGCGGAGGVGVPNSFGSADFRPSCNTHDCCYDRCNSSRAACDTTFLAQLRASCAAAYPGTGVVQTIQRGSCNSAANTYYGFVNSQGQTYYDAAQRQSCDCCGTQACPTCAGGACGNLPRCAATNPDCLCFTTPEGRGACIPGSTPCAGLRACSRSSDCPPGFGCAVTSCCGGGGVCGPLCTDVTPARGAGSGGDSEMGPTMGGRSSKSKT